MTTIPKSLEAVQRYYGEVLQSSKDLQTSACCTIDDMPRHIAEILPQIHAEVRDRFYGCGSPIPPVLDGLSVLDLGCGSGRDCYVLSKLVGRNGRVIGVDMTEPQLAVARRHLDYHANAFGFANVEFRQGYLEDLRTADLADCSIDLAVSNCVINLSPDKHRVFSEIFRVLKPGGELYFSDVFADRRIPHNLAQDPQLLGECLGGALYTEDFRRLIAAAGCPDARTVSGRLLQINNPDIEEKIGAIRFYSRTIRAFKLPLEDRCEDFGQVAYYQGTIADHGHAFALDDHHYLETGRPMLVCGNTADMLSKTRYAPHFRVMGEKSVHFGLFDCVPLPATAATAATPTGNGCC